MLCDSILLRYENKRRRKCNINKLFFAKYISIDSSWTTSPVHTSNNDLFGNQCICDSYPVKGLIPAAKALPMVCLPARKRRPVIRVAVLTQMSASDAVTNN